MRIIPLWYARLQPSRIQIGLLQRWVVAFPPPNLPLRIEIEARFNQAPLAIPLTVATFTAFP
jgi:hypothetical protein